MQVVNMKLSIRDNIVKNITRKCTLILIAVSLIGNGCGKPDPLESGLEYLQNGEYALAKDQLIKATEVYTNNPTAYCNLAIAQWKLGNTESALNSLHAVTEPDIHNPDRIELMAWIFIDMENREAARKALNLLKNPSSRLFSLMALVENKDGNTGAARAFLERALQSDPDYPPALYNLAVLNRSDPDNTRKALEIFKHFKSLAGNNPHAELTAEEFMNTTYAGNAATTQSTAPNKQVTAKIKEAKNAIAKGDLDVALVILKKAVTAYPDNADAFWELAVFYNKHIGKKKRARNLFIKFNRLFPNDPRSVDPVSAQSLPDIDLLSAQDHINNGLLYYKKKDWENAVRSYRMAVSADENSVAAAYNLGLAAKAMGNLSQASTSFRAAVRLKPDMLEARYMLALTERARKRTNDAIQQLEKIIQLNHDYSKAHFLLGVLFADSGQKEKAHTHFKGYLRLSPTGSSAAYAKRYINKQ